MREVLARTCVVSVWGVHRSAVPLVYTSHTVFNVQLLFWWSHIDELQVKSHDTCYVIPGSHSDGLLADTVLVEHRCEEPLALAKGAW